MKVLCIDKVKPDMNSRSDIAELLKREAQVAWQHYSDGVIREMYFRAPPEQGAILVLECSGLDEAKELLMQLPLTKAGVIEWEVIGLAPFTLLNTLFAETKAAQTETAFTDVEK